MATNPYAAIALKNDNPYAGIALRPNDATPTEKPPSLMQRAVSGAEDLGKGLLEGAGSTVYNIGSLLYPDWLARRVSGLTPEQQTAQTARDRTLFQPANQKQGITKGLEQAAEFLIPGAGEERAMSLLPKVGKEASLAMRLLQPVARVGYQGLTSGLVNKAQGGEFGTDAGVGLLGGVGGEAMKAAAPYLAESALGTRWLERGGGRGGGAIGKAALDETRGLLPETVRQSASDRISTLFGERQGLLDAASQRPAPAIRGFLQPPFEALPLADRPYVEGDLSRPIRLTQVDRPGPLMLQAPSLSTPMAPGLQDVFPERLASGDTGLRPTEFGAHSGMGQAQYFGEIPGSRGGPGEPAGVWQRRPPMSGSFPPISERAATASLAGPRSFLAQAQGRFGPIETGGMIARDPYSQIGEMRSSLFNEPAEMGGKPIPENLTPSEYGRLQQGFSRNNLSWNPLRTLDKEAMGAGKHAYGLMTGELERVAPESVDLNRRIASLMPVQEAANRRLLQAGIGQRMMGRVGAHSGALLGSVAGGTYGYEREGLPGAVKYGLMGLALPELVASPAGQMGAARLLYKTGPRLLPAVTGAGLGQLDRPRITSDPATW